MRRRSLKKKRMNLIKPIESDKILKRELKEIQNCKQALKRFIKFFQKFKVKKELEHKEEDMMLFQYGVYGNRPFEFNLTRQFEIPNEDEFLQLSLSLFYDYNEIGEIKSFNSWSAVFDSLDDWERMIEKTEGFKKVKELKPISMEIFICKT